MYKKRLFFLGVLSIYQTYAMDTHILVEQGKVVVNKQAYFKELLTHSAKLPTDLKKYVFNFLFHNLEFHDEFLTRVKSTEKKQVPIKYYYKDLNAVEFGNPIAGSFRGVLNIPTGWCPYQTNVVVLNRKYLQIIDSRNDSILYAQGTASHSCTHIALASDNHTIATIHKKEKISPTYPSPESTRVFSNMLTVKNLITLEAKSQDIDAQFGVAHPDHLQLGFGFNKQGTHIIIRGMDYQNKQSSSDDEPFEKDFDFMPDHVIIPVPINKPETHVSKYALCFLANQIWQGILPNNAKQ